jgi:hypothetical protein
MMIENWRSSGVWRLFMRNPDILRGLQRAGFVQVTLAADDAAAPARVELLSSRPNPVRDEATLRFALATDGPVRLEVFDAAGRQMARLADGTWGAGIHEVRWDAGAAPAGIYFARLTASGRTAQRTLVRVR